MKGSSAAVVLALLLPALTAQAQDSRRRVGEGTREETVAPDKPTKKKKKPAEPAPAEAAPAAPAEPAPPAEAAAPAATPRKKQARAATAEPATAEAAAPARRGRRRPGEPDYAQTTVTGERPEPGAVRDRRAFDPNRRSALAAVSPPPADAVYGVTLVPDRWQLTRQLGLTDYIFFDPYNQNTLKADRPIFGRWFFNLLLVSDTVYEPRRFPIPVAPQGEGGPGSQDTIGQGTQTVFEENLTTGIAIYQGDTTFRPPDWEFRFTPVFNFNRVDVQQYRALRVDPTEGDSRTDEHVGIQEAFLDKHLWNVGERYDFDSLRVGIQPFNADFRGFLFRDAQLGARLFGNRRNNFFQYNLAWFRRIEKDTNSGLNDLDVPLRKDDVAVANLYWQDLVATGLNTSFVVAYNRNREGDDDEAYYNKNGFRERPASFGRETPRNYDVWYGGGAGEGHMGPLNVSATAYGLFGKDKGGVFVECDCDVRGVFAATELSMDFDWRRVRLSALYASGDKNPYDDVETGYDAIFENPLFAGADTSFWIRENVPLIGGGGVAISGRNGVLNSLRSSKDEGQSNFVNPGTMLLGLGTDFDLGPRFRVSFNVNEIGFAETAVIEEARSQAGISRTIGTDVSMATVWRPLMTQNIVLRASGAALIPGAAYKQLYGDEMPYSVLVNLILTY
ncbi:MAG TPA: hypothetical protein VM369_08375 [Candidatus Binatia bacterium]|nr:hypothetical protein [Candidatus Binatia bacterium]